MADSSLPVTPGLGALVDVQQLTNGNLRQAVVIGDPSDPNAVAPVSAMTGVFVDVRNILLPIKQVPADQLVSITGAAGAAVTATLPAVAGLSHFINLIEIVKYATGAITGSATPVVVATTNMPGSLAWTFETAQAVGTIAMPKLWVPTSPLKSLTPGVNTTIVAPATSSIIWRINVSYYLA